MMERIPPRRSPRLFAVLLLLSCMAPPSLAGPPEGREAPAGMTVDYVNRSGEVVRVKVPEGTSPDPSMNFIVLDQAGRLVARLFPMEVQAGFFWSGPLEPRELASVKEGFAVVRADLDPGTAQRMRAAAQSRAAALRQAEREDQRAKVRKQMEVVEARIRSLRDDEAKIEVRRAEIDLSGIRTLRDLLRDYNQAQDRIEEKVDERERVARRRDDLTDQLLVLLRKTPTSQGEIDAIRRQLDGLDRDADRLSQDVRDLRSQVRSAQEEPLRLDEERQKALVDREEIRYRIKGEEEDRKALQEELSRI